MTDLEVTNKLTELKSYFASGKYWNHNCEYDNDVMSLRNIQDSHVDHLESTGLCGCNSFGRAIQCHGFALYLASLVFGSYPNIIGKLGSASNGKDIGDGWKLYTSTYAKNISLAPGDIIRVEKDENLMHTAIVWSVNGDTIRVAESLGFYGSKINWGYFNGGNIKTVSALKPLLTYVIKAPKSTTVSKVKCWFDGNGGSCNVSSQYYIKGSAYGNIPTPNPRSGYEFIGWWPEKDINSEEYTMTRIVPIGYEHKLYAQWGKKYKITNVGAGKCLNINGDNLTSLDNGRNVNLWSDTGSNEQKWLIPALGTRRIIKSVIDKNFGLNVKRSGTTYNCNVHRVFQNEADSVISIIPDGGYYKIKLYNYDLYLTATSNADGANVYWAAASTSNYQKWKFTQI